MQKLQANRLLLIILGGILLKLLYLFFIGPALFGDTLFITNDTGSYTASFINLVKTGHYTHTPGYEPASYGRLPGLPFIWGFFYLIFGIKGSFVAFAIFQVVLDAIAASLVFKIVARLFSEKHALFVTLLYVLFPFNYYYITKTGTEYLNVFVCIYVLYQLVFFEPRLENAAILGLTLSVGFLIRETLLLLAPLAVFYLWRHYSFNLKHAVVCAFFFLIVYLPWPLRNYLNHHVFVPVKELSAGYRSYNKDMLSFMYWIYAWHDSDMMDYFSASYNDTLEMKFPEEIFSSDSERKLADNLILLSRKCGSSFIDWKCIAFKKMVKANCNYDGLISRGFHVLKENYAEAHPCRYYVLVPLLNAKKALLKNTITINNEKKLSPAFRMLMLLRSIFLVTGIIACIIFWRQDFFKLIFLFFLVSLVFFCAILRQVEMRYFHEADALLWIAAACLISRMLFKRQAASEGQ